MNIKSEPVNKIEMSLDEIIKLNRKEARHSNLSKPGPSIKVGRKFGQTSTRRHLSQPINNQKNKIRISKQMRTKPIAQRTKFNPQGQTAALAVLQRARKTAAAAAKAASDVANLLQNSNRRQITFNQRRSPGSLANGNRPNTRGRSGARGQTITGRLNRTNLVSRSALQRNAAFQALSSQNRRQQNRLRLGVSFRNQNSTRVFGQAGQEIDYLMNNTNTNQNFNSGNRRRRKINRATTLSQRFVRNQFPTVNATIMDSPITLPYAPNNLQRQRNARQRLGFSTVSPAVRSGFFRPSQVLDRDAEYLAQARAIIQAQNELRNQRLPIQQQYPRANRQQMGTYGTLARGNSRGRRSRPQSNQPTTRRQQGIFTFNSKPFWNN